MTDDPAQSGSRSTSGSPHPIVQLGADHYQVHLPALDYGEVLSERRGEVAMVVNRAPGWLLLQSKQDYPPGVFRIPTGTIEAGEDPQTTLCRELLEETNLRPGVVRQLARLEYRVDGTLLPLYTVVFAVDSPQGVLRPNDPDEAIIAWREASLHELPTVADDLRHLEPDWQAWGHFRAAIHDLVFMVLAPTLPAD